MEKYPKRSNLYLRFVLSEIYTTMIKYLFCLSLSYFSLQSLAQFKVISSIPQNQALHISTTTPIVLNFEEAVDPSSINDTTFRVFGRWSGVAKGTFDFSTDRKQVQFTANQAFMHGEWITVNLSKDIRTLSGEFLPNGHAFNFWTATTSSSLIFEEIARLPIRYPGEGHIQSYGAYAGDLNKDGWSDLAIPNEQSNDVRVFYNDGAGGYQSFERYPLEDGAKPSANEGADFNLDGNIDFAVANTKNDKVHVLMGSEEGVFEVPKSYNTSLGVRGLAVLDFNWDGYDDIITSNRDSSNLSLLENQKDGTFKNVRTIETTTDQETAIVVADANNDGILDLFVGAFLSREVVLLLGDTLGEWQVSDQHEVLGNPWMMATGDLNGDGNADVVSANAYGNSVSVLFGNGKGQLSEPISYNAGIFPLAVDLGDLDGDGDLDMVSSQYASNDWIIFENDGLGNFSPVSTLQANEAGSCAILHDRDNNGDLEITAIDELSDELFLFDNISVATNEIKAATIQVNVFPNPAKNYLNIELELVHSQGIELRTLNLIGQVKNTIYEGQLAEGKHMLHIPVKEISGFYFIQIQTSDWRENVPIYIIKP